MAQFGRPNADITNTGGWSTAPLWSDIDDPVSSPDGASIASGNNPSTTDTFVVSLTTTNDPSSSVNHTIRVRAQDSGGARQVSLQMELRQGYVSEASLGTLIGTLSTGTLGAVADYTYTLSAGETNNITDYSDLFLRAVPNTTGGGSPNTVVIQAAEFEVPNATASITGTSGGTSTGSGTLEGTGDLDGSTSVTVTASGTLSGTGNLQGSSSGTSTVQAITGIGWYDPNWTYRVRIEANDAELLVADTEFLYYYPLSALPTADFWTNVKSDGSDVRVTRQDGVTEVPLHLVNFDGTGDKGGLFFKSYSKTSNIFFYIYYGNSGASAYGVADTYGRNNVYTGFQYAHQLNEDPATAGTGGIVDSTGSGTNFTPFGTTTGDSVTGKLDFNAYDFDLSQSDRAQATSTAAGTYEPSFPLTLLAWVAPKSDTTTKVIASRYYSTTGNRVWYWMLRYTGFVSGRVMEFSKWDTSNNQDAYVGDSAFAYSSGVFHHFATSISSSGTSAQHYQDGAALGSSGSLVDTSIQTTSNAVSIPTIGAAARSSTTPDLFVDATIQNLLIANTEWSANKIAQYYSQTNDPATFWATGSEETEGSIWGEITAAATASGTLEAAGAGDITGSASGSATASATGTLFGRVTGSSDGISTASGTLEGTGDLDGPSSGLSTGSGTLTAIGDLDGTSAGTSTGSATLQGIGDIDGSSGGTSTVSGTLSGIGDLDGSSPGTSTVSGTLEGTGDLVGSSDGLATVSGTLTSGVSIIEGSSAGTSTVSGTLEATGDLDGSISSAATVSGTLYAITEIDGTSAGTSTGSGTLSATGDLDGTSAGTSTGSGTLEATGDLDGSASGSTTVSGTLEGAGDLIGSSSGIATVSGTLSSSGSIIGSSDGISTVSGTLEATGDLTGQSNGLATVSGTLVGLADIDGSSAGSSTVSGTLDGHSYITGSSNGTSTVSGTIGAIASITGSANGTSVAQASISAWVVISAIASGVATASGVLRMMSDSVLISNINSGLLVSDMSSFGVILESEISGSVLLSKINT